MSPSVATEGAIIEYCFEKEKIVQNASFGRNDYFLQVILL
jgi:hypothetical protein